MTKNLATYGQNYSPQEGRSTLLGHTINTKIFAIQKKILRGINFVKITKIFSSPRGSPRSAWELQKKSVAATNSRKNYKKNKKKKKKPGGELICKNFGGEWYCRDHNYSGSGKCFQELISKKLLALLRDRPCLELIIIFSNFQALLFLQKNYWNQSESF